MTGNFKPAPLRTSKSPSNSQSRLATFSLTPVSSSSSDRHSPSGTPGDLTPEEATTPIDPPSSARHSLSVDPDHSNSGSITPPPTKTRSILNLTSSTLFGIYSPTGYDANRDEPETPWGTGAQTPSMRNGGPLSGGAASSRSLDEALRKQAPHNSRAEPTVLTSSRDRSETITQRSMSAKRRKSKSKTQHLLHLLWRSLALFLLGVTYALFITRLHETRHIAPVEVQINRSSWRYLCLWGLEAVVLGSLLPWVDEQQGRMERAGGGGPLEEELRDEKDVDLSSSSRRASIAGGGSAEWNPIVRSVGAFVGIAFAIRRLPWESTLQVSLTLALVNPVIWFLLDRTAAGFSLSFLTGLGGATTLMGINPDIVPPPPAAQDGGTLLGVSLESIGAATWIGSVFFCSCVCFGNVGRRLGRGLF